MKNSTIAASLLMATAISGAGQAMASPNVLLIIADDMGLDASACYNVGNQQASMPNIEALCEAGLVFENAHSSPTCSPTRATMMSGQYGSRTGVGAPVATDGSDELSVDTFTIFDALAPTGYATNLIGKWHITGRQSGYGAPADMGIPDYFGPYFGGLSDYHNWTAIENGVEVEIEGYATTIQTDRAIDWVGEQEQPWFLWLAYNAPHSPFHLPPADLHSSHDLEDDEAAISDNPLPYYQAMLEALDTEVGRLLSSIPEDTVVMFIGDNGSPNQVTSGVYGEHSAKASLYSSGSNVPLIVTGPNIDAGRTAAFVNTTDLAATITGLAGTGFDSQDSIDFGPVLAGAEGSRNFLYVEHFTERETKGGGMYGWAYREGDYKVVVALDADVELYNLVEDPMEQNDLLADGGTTEHLAISEALSAAREAIVAPAN
ncbi:Arylsulfatase A [Octadecabacter temperatus]|uniref:Choline-sulfatase n=1 Tax=Octadecabacter temperatus TaxID=1458307 RepID=A0A0K0Y2J9_9RHOB|nr:sulfatase-like hydrolase/transferase [Octadecabacter temperatus]AKS45132.1 Choline-sulfatase [Octadecabacter temperatus]SIN86789.1 Arylsulfatase A [Octadecabacter temperatus]